MSADVALFLPRLEAGGAERAMSNLAHGLAAQGYEVEFVLGSATGPFLFELPTSVRLIDLKTSRTAAALPALVRYLNRARPGVLVSTLAHANVIAVLACLLSGGRTRVYVREASMFPMEIPEGPRGWLLSRVLPYAYRRAGGVIAVSAGVARHVVRTFRVDPQRVTVIYNPAIGPDLFLKAAQPFEHPWFRAGEPPVVLAVGGLKKAKDFPTLLRAFSLLRRSARARLMILGEGRDRPALEALVDELGLGGDVSLPGFVANPFPYMRAAAVFVLSSVTEGLPNVLIQALALGTPGVATDCASGPSEICSGNPRARLVPVGDADRISEAMLEALRLPPCTSAPPEFLRRFGVEENAAQFARALGLEKAEELVCTR